MRFPHFKRIFKAYVKRLCNGCSDKRVMDTRGFTLIEVILVVLVIGLLSVSALNTYYDSARTFAFLNNFDPLANYLRTARSYAINNFVPNELSAVEEEGLDRYGVMLEEDRMWIFADSGSNDFSFDKGPDEEGYEADYILPGFVHCWGQADDSFEPWEDEYCLNPDYELEIYDDVHTLPIAIFYESSSAEITALEELDYDVDGANEADLIDKSSVKYIGFDFSRVGPGAAHKYVVLFTLSGMPEEMRENFFTENI